MRVQEATHNPVADLGGAGTFAPSLCNCLQFIVSRNKIVIESNNSHSVCTRGDAIIRFRRIQIQSGVVIVWTVSCTAQPHVLRTNNTTTDKNYLHDQNFTDLQSNTTSLSIGT